MSIMNNAVAFQPPLKPFVGPDAKFSSNQKAANAVYYPSVHFYAYYSS